MNTQIEKDGSFIRDLLQLDGAAAITYVDSGWTSRVYLVDGGRRVVKFPRSDATREEYIHEIAVLELLEGIESSIRVPRITHRGDNNDYMAYDGIVGTAFDMLPGEVAGHLQQSIGHDLGGFLKQLHQLQLDSARTMTLDDEIAQFQQKYEEGKVGLDTLTAQQ
jgi:Ser/Thr protein kinase RdoA (MazF antagonist)